MPRPTSKESLLTLSQENYGKLIHTINLMAPQQQEQAFAFEDRDKNIRDVLIHLHEWHNMMANWYAEGMAGQKPAIPAPGYTFRTTPALNLKIWEACQQTPLSEAKVLLQQSHQQMTSLIQAHSDEELFTKKFYTWTNTSSLGSYLVSATSSHYDWALKKVKKHIKTM